MWINAFVPDPKLFLSMFPVCSTPSGSYARLEARDGELLFGQRDTDHAAADPLRDAHAHGAPTAADLKHAVRGQQPGAGDDLIELAELR